MVDLRGSYSAMKILPKLLAGLLFCGLVSSGYGAVEIFLHIDGIDGNSLDQDHVGDISVVSFKAGVMQRGLGLAGGAASAATSDFKPLTVYKFIDQASPKLFLACATGQHAATATLTVRKTGAQPFDFFIIKLRDVIISSVNADADTTDANGTLVETVSLSYTRIEWTFVPQRDDGSAGTPIIGGFDVRSNKKL